MGARAQVKIKDTGVYLYTHWGAGSIVQNVQDALSRRERWSDPEYLGRIIFEQMTAGQTGSALGFGIGTGEHGDIQILVTVDVERQKVEVKDIYENVVKEIGFKEFVAG